MKSDLGVIKGLDGSPVIFDYTPRELNKSTSAEAIDFVSKDNMKSPDFRISDLVAQQTGISKLESEAHQDKINEQVLVKVKEIEEKAYKEGYELGLIDGAEKAFQEQKLVLVDKIKQLEDMLTSVENMKKQTLVDNEEGFIKLVFQVARKIAMRELQENRDAVLEILQHVVNELHTDESIDVRLSPEDIFFIEQLQEKSGQKLDILKKTKLVADEAVTSGGCVLETKYGSVDASVEERVNRAWEILSARIPHKQEPGS